MALTKAQRLKRRAHVLAELRRAWWHRPRPTVELVLQRGLRRPRVRGRVEYVATSGAFALLDDGEPVPLHVPVDAIRSVTPT